MKTKTVPELCQMMYDDCILSVPERYEYIKKFGWNKAEWDIAYAEEMRKYLTQVQE